MSGFEPLGKLIIFTGVFIVILGLLLTFWDRVRFLGRLAGDIFWQNGSFQVFFPIMMDNACE